MLHIVRLIERRFPTHGVRLLPALLSASALLAAIGAALLAAR